MDNVFIIAEAGVNHNGSLEQALKLIDVASDAGADAVKFQSFKASKLLLPNTEKANYQKNNTAKEESSFDLLRRLELSEASHQTLRDYCKKKSITFMSTPFDLDSIDLLVALDCRIFKIASGEITNRPYLEKIGQLNQEIILSTGMACLGEIEDALNVITQAGTAKNKITVLHATTEYPAPYHDVNLRAMQTIAQAFQIRVGYSDHTKGIEIPLAAVAMGARVIEKHFTLDRTLPGPDHIASIEPHELRQMIASIRNIEQAMGSAEKKAGPSELQNKALVRKSIVTSQAISQGAILDASNIAIKRPGHGLSPMRWYEVLGTAAKRDYSINECID